MENPGLPGGPEAHFRPEGEPTASSPSEGEARAAAVEGGRRPRSAFLEALVLVFTALLLALTLKSYVAEAYEIKGSSMEPTFQSGQRVVLLKAFYEIGRGDIVIFTSTEDENKDLIKRVVGLPGEHIRIVGDKVLINGKVLEEDYVGKSARDPYGRYHRSIEEVMGPGEFFVLGDNRGDSHDSRRFHGVPVHKIKGKVIVRWWPMGELESF